MKDAKLTLAAGGKAMKFLIKRVNAGRYQYGQYEIVNSAKRMRSRTLVLRLPINFGRKVWQTWTNP